MPVLVFACNVQLADRLQVTRLLACSLACLLAYLSTKFDWFAWLKRNYNIIMLMSELGSSVVIYSSWFLSSIYFLSLSVVGVDVVFVAVAAVSISAISNGDLL